MHQTLNSGHSEGYYNHFEISVVYALPSETAKRNTERVKIRTFYFKITHCSFLLLFVLA